MDIDARGRSSLEFKAEDDSGDTRMGDDKPTYRSWKKKYRKMRIVFDQKMHEGEELHKLEQKALATARRLAIQKDRLLDLLLDVNNSDQIPLDKRFDLSLDPPSDSEALCLDIDRPSTPPERSQPIKSYKRLAREVPHSTFASAPKKFEHLLADLEAGRDSPADPLQGQPHPPSFLTADDIDNYIWEIDTRLAANNSHKNGTAAAPLPTLAPLAHASDHPSNGAYGAKDSGSLSNNRDFALRNPTSVYNWLRKHAPRTFLQDGEAHPDKENGDEAHPPSARGHGRGKGERGAGRGTGGPGRGKRASAAHHVRDKTTVAVAETTEFDDDAVYETPGAAAGKGKRKRTHDEDPGYRPKGGSSRPTKKKRKSEGGVESTPTAPTKRARKSGGADVSRGGED
ncbi:IEC3 subunit of the Ino80 complex, chromatin re-modelling-domain-containing protein [Lasiosphaeris hirsuta]|uniref:IEC3 subunit of the Ino80 complex, chromatin re-modelling-domain-containing protein n=1 Tax=Lasiosphaeris hirsuta TaxID=260670 RepID=A0AA40DNS0_9PEZI|nr:IEC3 subunit of the Ino80 complex, chromatin re-modelling-domain-containing protein [Lasiosphaeris hirsuta]